MIVVGLLFPYITNWSHRTCFSRSTISNSLSMTDNIFANTLFASQFLSSRRTTLNDLLALKSILLILTLLTITDRTPLIRDFLTWHKVQNFLQFFKTIDLSVLYLYAFGFGSGNCRIFINRFQSATKFQVRDTCATLNIY